MGVIVINDSGDEMLEQLEKRATDAGFTPQQFVRENLGATIMPRETRSGVKFNAMYGELSAFKDHDWEAGDVDEIAAWENSKLR